MVFFLNEKISETKIDYDFSNSFNADIQVLISRSLKITANTIIKDQKTLMFKEIIPSNYLKKICLRRWRDGSVIDSRLAMKINELLDKL